MTRRVAGGGVYPVVLLFHSYWRWLVLLVLLVRGLKGVVGFLQKSEYGALDKRLSLASIIVVDVQLLLGILLFAISPTIRIALADPGGAMKNDVVRLLFVEHPFTMIVGIVLVHVGHTLGKRPTRPDPSRHRIAAAMTLLGLGILLTRIPW
jgi:hypothetical protein